jgi:hypothetical protein
MCLNAQNTDGTWAGVGVCGGLGQLSHPYDKTYVRRGIVCAQGGGSMTLGFGWQTYYVP